MEEALRMPKIKHGHAAIRSPIYKSWRAAKQRCFNPRDKGFPGYGGRGIGMSKIWAKNFQCFLADMGERPSGKSLDRINNNGNYEPGNCRWATATMQARNTRRNRLLTYNGKTLCVEAWRAKLSMTSGAMQYRLSRKWPAKKVLGQPIRSMTRPLTYNNKTLCIEEWAKQLGVNYSSLYGRVWRGWSIKRIFEQPFRSVKMFSAYQGH